MADRAAGQDAGQHRLIPDQALADRVSLWSGTLRVVMVTIGLAVVLLFHPIDHPVSIALACYLGGGIILLAILGLRPHSGLLAWFQSLLDAFAIASVTYLVGSATSVSAMVFLVPLAGLAIRRGPRRASIYVVMSLALYYASLVLVLTGVLPPMELLSDAPAHMPNLAETVNAAMLVTMGLGVSYGYLLLLTHRIELAHTSEREAAQAERVAREQAQRLQRKLEETQRLESLGRLAGGISHDFNNLLTVILGNISFVKGRGDHTINPDELDEIEGASRRASELTAQLLAFSRKQVIEPKQVQPNPLVTGVVRMTTRLLGERVKVSTELGTINGVIKVDPTQMEQILVNLLVNARDALPNGGEIRLTTSVVSRRPDSEDADTGLRRTRGPQLQISVADDGVGMDKATLRRVFEPFFTTKDIGKGTGLGLAMVYGAVKQHAGHVKITSAPGHGTQVDVYLPLFELEEVAQPTQAIAVPTTGSETILLVEDEQMVRRLAARALSQAGYQIVEAASGVEALTLMERDPQRIQLLLSDVVMPDLSGPELLQQIRVEHPTLPVLFMSGYPDDELIRHKLPTQTGSILAKPFVVDELLRRVRQTLDQSTPATEM